MNGATPDIRPADDGPGNAAAQAMKAALADVTERERMAR